MIVQRDDSALLLAPVIGAARVLVFLTVPWSGPESTARMAFRLASEKLAAEFSDWNIQCFYLDEEAEWCQAWLATLKLPMLGGGYPLGVGSILWLEFGRAISHEFNGQHQLQPAGIVARSRWFWAKSARPGIA